MMRIILSQLFFFLLFSLAAGKGAFSASGARPNFLVIVVDDQGYADLSAYEHSAPDIETPHMDRLAGRGVLFTNAYATAAVCSPARAGWNTGQHQARWDPKSSFNCGLPQGTPTLASMLKANGYATAKIGKNDYSNRSIHKHDVYEYPLNHGYDEFLGFAAHGFDFFLLSEDIKRRTSRVTERTVPGSLRPQCLGGSPYV